MASKPREDVNYISRWGMRLLKPFKLSRRMQSPCIGFHVFQFLQVEQLPGPVPKTELVRHRLKLLPRDPPHAPHNVNPLRHSQFIDVIDHYLRPLSSDVEIISGKLNGRTPLHTSESRQSSMLAIARLAIVTFLRFHFVVWGLPAQLRARRGRAQG